MALTEAQAIVRGTELLEQLRRDRSDLDPLRRYWLGWQKLPAVIKSTSPREVWQMVRMARVNVIDIVVESLKQSLIVDGYRADAGDDDDDDDEINVAAWKAWQANKLDRRQAGLHAATVGYGAGYMIGLPGTGGVPVLRPASPRMLTAAYGDHPDWPVDALEKRRGNAYRLYDNEMAYDLELNPDNGKLRFVGSSKHGAVVDGEAVCPVVRYLESEDLDFEDEVERNDHRAAAAGDVDESNMSIGQINKLVKLQDQIDLTTFALLIAQHYTAFRQRLLIGWVADDEKKQASAASQLWTIDDDPENVKVHEFAETNLGGYINSRKEMLRYAAILSQTPVHELIGELVNLSAEALAAAEAGRERKVGVYKLGLGESHEQSLGLAAAYMGQKVPEDAQIIWRDLSARAFAAVIDGLGKLVQMLGIPPTELWERVPGFTRKDVQRMKSAAAEGDSLATLTRLLDGQGQPAAPTTVQPGETTTDSGLVLPAGVTV